MEGFVLQREWPQHWPGLLSELDTLCRLGETQTELVMFILLRLVEGEALSGAGGAEIFVGSLLTIG